MPEPGLGRIYVPDDRDADYPMRALLAAAPVPLPPSRLWTPGPILDQGQKPQCCAFAGRGWLSAQPNHDQRKSPVPSTLYRGSQKLDGIPMPHDGTTVRALLKTLQGLKRIGTYHWAATVDDMKDWTLGHGCCIVGFNWYESYFTPDATGLVTISGSIAGGHSWLVNGYDRETDLFACVNSWGPSWSVGGTFKIRAPEMARLLSEDGEAAAALEHAA